LFYPFKLWQVGISKAIEHKHITEKIGKSINSPYATNIIFTHIHIISTYPDIALPTLDQRGKKSIFIIFSLSSTQGKNK